MKKLSKKIIQVVAAVAVCASLSACGQQPVHSSAGFPAYSAQAVSGQVLDSIMDY